MKIYIEGNIGAGKSTFLKKIQSFLPKHVAFIQEPVNEWIKSGMLDLFYKDMNRWSFSFQLKVLSSRLNALINNDKNIAFIERSVFTDKYCFAKLLHENGTFLDQEWDLYVDMYERFTENKDVQGDLFIYIKVDPDECAKRIHNRHRDGEDDIPIEYLKQLHQKHEEWLMKEPNRLVLTPNEINDPDFENIFLEMLREKHVKL